MAAIEINESQFQKLMADGKTVLVDYWAPWCSYCRRLEPVYERIAEQYGDTVTVAKLNIDNAQELARVQKIDVIPTLILYRDGKALSSITAPDSKAAIDAFLKEAL